MLKVGIDTYVSVEEAQKYIEEFYLPKDKQRIAWEGLSDEDKNVYLRKACALIEQNIFNGTKTSENQVLSFPRNNNENVPQNIKHAQIEECLELACPTQMTEDSINRNSAVTSYSIGHLSESYEKAVLGEVSSILTNIKAQQYILSYTRGGFHVT